MAVDGGKADGGESAGAIFSIKAEDGSKLGIFRPYRAVDTEASSGAIGDESVEMITTGIGRDVAGAVIQRPVSEEAVRNRGGIRIDDLNDQSGVGGGRVVAGLNGKAIVSGVREGGRSG